MYLNGRRIKLWKSNFCNIFRVYKANPLGFGEEGNVCQDEKRKELTSRQVL